MSSILSSELTPCGAMFEMFKRHGGISHKELAVLVLSERPLSDGRSPVSRASDRTWLSRFIVNAPVSSLQPRFFRDFGLAGQRVMDRVRAKRRSEFSGQFLINLICGDAGKPMEYALAACHQDVSMYRNALERFSHDPGYTAGERAETLTILFIAVGCTANVKAAVAYTNEYVESILGGHMGTPKMLDLKGPIELREPVVPAASLGLVRVADGYISGTPYWISPYEDGVTIGCFAMGENDITSVEADVSANHARIWCEDGSWYVRDLESTNGTRLVSGATGEETLLVPEEPTFINAGDELRLGAATTFMVVTGSVTA
ncbi:MAG: FHA domain-containing protein [Coriobacteriaceae bacterium]|nr:FHA domain-containing protein [Coriobacteriaceae bacterium]